ncbi:MAG: helix-turn-helix transcriptional regulator [Dehalococcoidia bacterium]
MNKLREARKARGLSQLRLSFLTNIPPATISRIENNHVQPFPGWRRRLSNALGATEHEIFPNGGADGK